MTLDILVEIAKYLLPAVGVVVWYGIKRRVERTRRDEDLGRKDRVLEIHAKLKHQGMSPDDLKRLEKDLFGESTPSPTKSPTLVSMLPLVATRHDLKLWEMLAIHAGNEAQDAGTLRTLFPEVVSQERVDLAQATFHAAYRVLLQMKANTETMHLLSDYEKRIPVPTEYEERLEQYR
jgi:hypothetical protein